MAYHGDGSDPIADRAGCKTIRTNATAVVKTSPAQQAGEGAQRVWRTVFFAGRFSAFFAQAPMPRREDRGRRGIATKKRTLERNDTSS
jgi:hypothetical protein